MDLADWPVGPYAPPPEDTSHNNNNVHGSNDDDILMKAFIINQSSIVQTEDNHPERFRSFDIMYVQQNNKNNVPQTSKTF